VNDSESGSCSDEDDYFEELPPLKLAANKKGGRSSVSAEAYGLWNKKTNFKPKVVAKSEASKKKILLRLSQAFMFSNLDEKERQVVSNAMEEKKYRAGDFVIKQGEDGEELFVVESGKLSCHKKFAQENDPKFLKNYSPGEAFGELALLYNAPRAATIIATEDSVLWSLDRNTFNHIVKDSASKKREKYEEFLKNVKLLSTIDPYERSKIADAFKPESYNPGEYVISEGEAGNTFYFIEKGEAVATKTIEKGKPPKEVMQYKAGDYFGELALLKNEPRAANVIAKSALNIVSLDRDSFKRLLGPMEEILKRNVEMYKQYC